MALAFAQCLLQLLESLPEPIVPVTLHQKCAQISGRDEAFELLDELPSGSANQPPAGDFEKKKNPSRAESLAAIFGPVFLRDDETLSHFPISPIEKSDFLLYFIN